MSNPETFADELNRCARMALSGPVGCRETFAIGPVEFELSAPAASEGEWLGRAFLPLDRTPRVDRPHRLFAWDTTNAAPPQRPWGPSDHEPLGIINAHSNEAVRCAFDVHTGSLIVFDFRGDLSFTWYPRIAELPAWAKASPFRIALSWLLNRYGLQIVHGAAVSIEGQAVLLAGAGGAGKSTTALACTLAGTGYLGDDYCAIDPAAGEVHLIYRTAKVLPQTLAMVPALRPWLVNYDHMESEKGVMFLDPRDVELVRSAKLAAIMLPSLAADGRTRVLPASRAEAIQAILPSTVGGLMGGTSVTPKAILRLVRDVPAFRLELGNDLGAVAETVASKLLVA